jgi:hypothetical protein
MFTRLGAAARFFLRFRLNSLPFDHAETQCRTQEEKPLAYEELLRRPPARNLQPGRLIEFVFNIADKDPISPAACKRQPREAFAVRVRFGAT